MNQKLSKEELARYARHTILDEVGLEGQERLKNSSVLCIGAGGLGSPLLLYLSAAGVDASNLQRQIVHNSSNVGHKKVESAVERLKEINPFPEYETYDVTLNSDNALEIMKPYDVIVDGTDNFATRYLINDACVLLHKPNVYGSIYQFEGQVSVFNYRGGPNYRDLYPDPPPPGLVPSCAEAGVLGVLPGVIGTIQATEVLKIILEKGDILSGRLLLYDALEMGFRELAIQRDPNGKPITELIDYQAFCSGKHRSAQQSRPDVVFHPISVSETAQKLENGWSPYVLDVRTLAESDFVTLSFTDRLCPYDALQPIIDEIPRDRDILVYCKVGGRSAIACQLLSAQGFGPLYNLEGGITAWAREIDTDLPTY
jgi:adenylyltransferase/sulfurtransferase